MKWEKSFKYPKKLSIALIQYIWFNPALINFVKNILCWLGDNMVKAMKIGGNADNFFNSKLEKKKKEFQEKKS